MLFSCLRRWSYLWRGNKNVTELLHLYVVSSVLLSNVHFLLGLIVSLHRVHSPLTRRANLIGTALKYGERRAGVEGMGSGWFGTSHRETLRNVTAVKCLHWFTKKKKHDRKDKWINKANLYFCICVTSQEDNAAWMTSDIKNKAEINPKHVLILVKIKLN